MCSTLPPQVSWKPIFSVSRVKKINEYLVKRFFSTEFCIFYVLHKRYQFFVKQFYKHIERQDVRVIFFVENFNILKYL
jgi:hypothetical protein